MLYFKDHTYKSFTLSILSAMKTVRRDPDNHAMTTAMRLSDRQGLWLEFGVFDGFTLSHMAKYVPDKIVYGFDSFRGLPERWRDVSYNTNLEKYVKKQAFDKNGNPPIMKEHNIAFVIGWFNETLPQFLKEHADRKISFLHIDSDLYSSAHYVLEKIKTSLSNHSIVVFDELVNYPEYKQGEMKALWDVFKNTPHAVEVIAHSCNTVTIHPKVDIWPQSVALRLQLS